MQKRIVTIILKMISTIAVIVLSPFGHFSRLPYYASNVLMSDRTLFGHTKISFISQGEKKVDNWGLVGDFCTMNRVKVERDSGGVHFSKRGSEIHPRGWVVRMVEGRGLAVADKTLY